MTSRILLIILPAALLLLSGCAGRQPQPDPLDHYLALSGPQIIAEIEGLEKNLAANDSRPAGAPAPESLYHLAMLYSHVNNPAPDYDRAAALLDDYIADLPHGPKKYRLLHTLDLLHVIDVNRLTEEQCRQLTEERESLLADRQFLESDNAALKKEGAALRRTVDRLKKENKKMKNSIEQLKMLDLTLEEKKRSIQ